MESVENPNYEPQGNRTREWVAIRGECISGGELNDFCDLVAETQGVRRLEVVQKKLACGCILVPADSEEIIL